MRPDPHLAGLGRSWVAMGRTYPDGLVREEPKPPRSARAGKCGVFGVIVGEGGGECGREGLGGARTGLDRGIRFEVWRLVAF
jgi:hypothetical protein